MFFRSLLETIHFLVIFSHQCDIFICDYLAVVEVCQGQLYSLYFDLATCLCQDVFEELGDLVTCMHDIIPLTWVSATLDLNECVEHLAIKSGTSDHLATFVDEFGETQHVHHNAFTTICEDAKALCQGKFLSPFVCVFFSFCA